MKVKFKYTWFAATDNWEGWPAQRQDKVRSISGRRYRRGHVYDIPEEMLEFLPKSVEILDKEYVEKKDTKKEEELESLTADPEGDALQDAEDKANEALEKKRANIAKARAAKKGS